MIELVHIPNLDRGSWYSGPGPGWWIGTRDGRRVVELQCGGCHRHAGHLGNHTIEPDGRVHASILCPNVIRGVPCGWHVYGVLRGWNRSRKGPGEEPARNVGEDVEDLRAAGPPNP